MDYNTEKAFIDQLKVDIEKALKWGSSDDWKHKDFQNLSEKIFQHSKVILSPSTLKRVWGKIKYEGLPNTSTLDSLASYVGYENWLAYKTTRLDGTVPTPTPSISADNHQTAFENYTADRIGTGRNIKKFAIPVALFMLVGVIVAFALSKLFKSEPKEYAKSDEPFVFELAAPPRVGVPQTIIIKYDISKLSGDSIYLYEGDRKWVEYLDKGKNRYPYFCRKPGPQVVKLMQGTKELATINFNALTNDWQPVFMKSGDPSKKFQIETLPEYFKLKTFDDGQMQITKDDVRNAGIETHENDWIHFYLWNEFGIDANNYKIETRLKNSLADGATTCQVSIFSITTENGLHECWLVAPGCTKFVHVYFGKQSPDMMVDSKISDLTGFECDLSDWRTLRWEVIDKRVKVFLDDAEIFSKLYDENTGKILGIKYQFKGIGGAVDYLKIWDKNDSLLYNEQFDGTPTGISFPKTDTISS